MARIGISLTEVAAAFEKLLQQGEQPTAERIQALLDKGSVATIQKLLKQIAEQSRLDLSTQLQQQQIPQPEAQPQLDMIDSQSITEDIPLFIPVPTQEAQTEAAHPMVMETKSEDTPVSEMTSLRESPPPKRFQKRERYIPQRQDNSPQTSSNKTVEVEEVVEAPLEQLSEETLITKIRRLESTLLKEQMRREVSEKIAEETKDYAESIKEQVAQRINELRENMDIVIEQLKAQLREQKQNFDQDLKYYQEHLSKANEKIAELLK